MKKCLLVLFFLMISFRLVCMDQKRIKLKKKINHLIAVDHQNIGRALPFSVTPPSDQEIIDELALKISEGEVDAMLNDDMAGLFRAQKSTINAVPCSGSPCK